MGACAQGSADSPQGVIYFIRAEGVGRIKIGFSTNFEKRLRDLQGASPVRLKVLKLVRGSQSTEQVLLGVFGKYRLHGEWFAADKTLLDFISGLTHKQIFSPEMLAQKLFKKSRK